MRKKYCIGFFVVIFLFLVCLELGYRWSYQRSADNYEQNKELVQETEEMETVMATEGNAEKNSEYLLKELNGYVIVYLGDEKTVYEVTEIAVDELPDEVQTQIREGMRIQSTDELYAFLENYSS